MSEDQPKPIVAGQWETYLGHRVRVHCGTDRDMTSDPMAEGVVRAVCMVPMLMVERDYGEGKTWVATSLPMAVQEWRAL